MTQKMTEAKKYRIYGIIALIVLFLIGIFVGWTLDGGNKNGRHEYNCDKMAQLLQLQALHNTNAEEVKELTELYSKNCHHGIVEKKQQPQKQVDKKLPERNCEAIEQLLKDRLMSDDTYYAHASNAEIYGNLMQVCCDENREKYAQLGAQEVSLAETLKQIQLQTTNTEDTCKKIERVLSERIGKWDGMNAEDYIRNAETYANLAERGCEQNKQKYKELAQQQLEIARALTDDNVSENTRETKEMIQVYKRIQMKQEAQKIIDKAKKIADPAIDFIIQLEKIIEE